MSVHDLFEQVLRREYGAQMSSVTDQGEVIEIIYCNGTVSKQIEQSLINFGFTKESFENVEKYAEDARKGLGPNPQVWVKRH